MFTRQRREGPAFRRGFRRGISTGWAWSSQAFKQRTHRTGRRLRFDDRAPGSVARRRVTGPQNRGRPRPFYCVCACTGGRALVPARIWPRNHDRLCLVFARILARGPANASASSVSGWRAGKRPKEKHDRAPDSPPPTAVLLGVHACTCTGEGGRCPGEDLAKKSRPARPGLRTHSSRGPTERVGALGSTIARREASQKEGRPGRRRPFC